VTVARSLLPIGLAFAAGAMLYVVFQEIIPESHRRGYQREATFSTLFGVLAMVTLPFFCVAVSSRSLNYKETSRILFCYTGGNDESRYKWGGWDQ